MPLQLSGQIISKLRNGRKILLASINLFHLQALHHREWSYLYLPGSD